MYVYKGFRPLTGINFNEIELCGSWLWVSFRPLTGINFNMEENKMEKMLLVSVPSRG